MKQFSIFLIISLLIISNITGIGIGYYLTPEYSLTMYDKSMDLGPSDRFVDLRYINAMISHHKSAILLANQASKSQRKEISDLAKEIQTNEPKSIEELYKFKKEWFNDYRLVKDPTIPILGNYDDTFDLRFLNALISHHNIGILMTKEIKLKSSRAEIINNADTVENFLNTTLTTFKEWRKNWYNIN